jgi:hypothetical protein
MLAEKFFLLLEDLVRNTSTFSDRCELDPFRYHQKNTNRLAGPPLCVDAPCPAHRSKLS